MFLVVGLPGHTVVGIYKEHRGFMVSCLVGSEQGVCHYNDFVTNADTLGSRSVETYNS